jgi:hypothetical protein
MAHYRVTMSDTASPPGPAALPYQQTAAFEWTQRAFELLSTNTLTVTTRRAEGIDSVVVAGPCPRCTHQLVDRQVGVAVAGVAGGAPRGALPGAAPPEAIVVDVTCGCGVHHDGAPETATGCGVSFRIELVATDPQAIP